MKMRRSTKTLLGVVLFLSMSWTVLRGQDFLEGINLFNRAQYDSLISHYAPAFIRQHPEAEGLARYFVAESFYNLGLQANTPEQARQRFQRAWEELNAALKRPDLRSRTEGYFDAARYKAGWCSYRLAELSEEPLRLLERAHLEFARLNDSASDSLRLVATFMQAECLIRAAREELPRLAAEATTVAELERWLARLDEAETRLDALMKAPVSPEVEALQTELAQVANLRKTMLRAYRARLFAVMPASLVQPLLDEGASAAQTAVNRLAGVRYDSLFVAQPDVRQRYQSTLAYLNAVRYLEEYFLTGSEVTRHAFLREWAAVHPGWFGAERWFRRANLAHSLPVQEDSDSTALALRLYARADEIDESAYWRGYLHMIRNEAAAARANFQRFLEAWQARPALGYRERLLYDDARYRKYLLDFESYYLNDRLPRLLALSEELEDFKPHSVLLRQQKQQLALLVHASLISNPTRLWDKALGGTEAQKVERVFDTIEFILPRAALNIGVVRQKYLALMSRLLRLTGDRSSDETRFFLGLAQALEADIQARPDEKERMFREAAKVFRSISHDYPNKVEADYIRGVCLFFADELDEAEKVFRTLINEQRYLRALFYLAEIFRVKEQGRAAKRCYSVIIDKFQDARHNSSEFWLTNARAGLSASEDTGTLDVLQGLQIEAVTYRLAEDDQRLYFERLANERFLARLLLRQSVAWLMRYGLPTREFYPSRYKLRASRFNEPASLLEFPGLDERRGPLTAGLEVAVVLPPGVTGGIQVFLDTLAVPARGDGRFVLEGIPLNSRAQLRITAPQCYEHREWLNFRHPRTLHRALALSRQVRFAELPGEPAEAAGTTPVLPTRWDRNRVLHALPALAEDAELVRDFRTGYELRDVAVDSANNRILAVHADRNEIWVYRLEPQARRVGVIRPELTPPLNSPEGLAVSPSGHILVADWGNHRIVELDSAGVLVQTLGTFGRNTAADAESSATVKLTFPTRVTVLTDRTGVRRDGQTYYRETYLLVADHNGVHLCRRNGDYLGTLIPPSHDLPRGAFSALSTLGYGPGAQLYVLDQSGDARARIRVFVAR